MTVGFRLSRRDPISHTQDVVGLFSRAVPDRQLPRGGTVLSRRAAD